MSRISKKFLELKAEGRKGFIPFITAGDPSLETSRSIVLSLASLGADVIELGVPFSDPMADGATIQRSSARSVEAGTRLPDVLNLVKSLRGDTDVPIMLFSYYNPIFRMGIDRFVDAAADAGVDGLLLVDVIGEEAAIVRSKLDAREMDLVSLVAPTTSDARLDEICSSSRGFIYAVSRAGVTGAHADPAKDAAALVGRVRARSDIPVAVGFGISTRDHVESVWNFADAAVVGSAIVATIECSDDPVAAVESLVASLIA